MCRGIEFHHDVDVTVGASIATRVRTEQRRVTDAAGAQGGFILPQLGKDFPAIHPPQITHGVGRYQMLRVAAAIGCPMPKWSNGCGTTNVKSRSTPSSSASCASAFCCCQRKEAHQP